MTAADDSLMERALAGRPAGPALLGAISLLAANLGLLVVYLFLDLTLEQLVIVYWWESLWIGLFAALKLVAASLFGDPYRNRLVEMSAGTNLFVSLLAICFVSGEFLGMFLLSGLALWFALAELAGADPGRLMFDELPLLLGTSLLFLASHGLSFIVNFLFCGEFRHARATTLLALPLRRCLAIYLAIGIAFACAFALPAVARTSAFVLLLVLLKLLGDYRLHRQERRLLAAANGD